MHRMLLPLLEMLLLSRLLLLLLQPAVNVYEHLRGDSLNPQVESSVVAAVTQ
jgi:hypothetical protein